LPGPKGLNTKKAAAALVRDQLPGLDISKTRGGGFHDGLADAGAIALYGLATYGPALAHRSAS
jgi:hypothetical protein